MGKMLLLVFHSSFSAISIYLYSEVFMKLSFLFSALSAGLLSLGLSAQTATTISPKVGATQGNTNNNIPYSWYPTRYQQIFDYDSFSHGNTPFLMKGVRYRMNKSFANGRYGGSSVTLSMWLGDAAKGITSSSYSRIFDSNMNQTTKKMVIKKKLFFMPKLSNQNFDIKFPFDSGSIFLLVPTKKIALVQEVITWGNTNGNRYFTYPMDVMRTVGTVKPKVSRLYAFDSSAGSGTYTTNGSFRGCRNLNNGLPSQYSNTTDLKIGGKGYYLYGYSRLASAPTFLVLGLKSLNVPIFGKGCFLKNDLVFILPGIAQNSSSGYIRYNLPIPNLPALANAKFYSQMWFAQVKSSGPYFYASRGLVMTIGDGKVKSPALFKTAKGATTNYGLITQFHN